jgi:hypothetical protein
LDTTDVRKVHSSQRQQRTRLAGREAILNYFKTEAERPFSCTTETNGGTFGARGGEKSLKKSKMDYSNESVAKLIENDSSRYEPSRQHVVNEYFELSRQSFFILKKKIKV